MLVILDVVPNHAGRGLDYDLDGDGEVDPGEIEPPWSDVPYDVPLSWTARPRMFAPGGELVTLGAEHFHRRGRGDLGVPIQKELGDFPTGLRDLDTESPGRGARAGRRQHRDPGVVARFDTGSRAANASSTRSAGPARRG
ncbi:MAG TPA: hypothetical protein VIL20_29490 [Sandaracinaceae bacterium]